VRDEGDLHEAIGEAMEASGNLDWMHEIDFVKAFLAYQICVSIEMILTSGFRGSIKTEFGVMDNPPSDEEKRKLLRLRRRLIKSCLPSMSAQVLLQRLDAVENASQARHR
jgi:hypothetical protein